MIEDDIKNNIPCHNCLILGICRQKRRILCILLQDYFFSDMKRATWIEVNGYLPNVVLIVNEPDVLGRYDVHNWNLINEEVKKKGKGSGIEEFNKWLAETEGIIKCISSKR